MSESDHEAEGGSRAGEEHGDLVDTAPRGRLLPLNSRRLTSAHLKQIAESLGLPTTGSSDEIRQLIEGKLQESRDVRNIQVVVDETPTISLKLSLMDEDGVFLESTPIVKPVKEMGEDLTLRLTEAEQKNAELQVELAETREQLTKQQEETARLTEEMSSTSTADEVRKLKDELKQEREKAKRAWRMGCAQVAEQESLLAKREDEIVELQERLRACMRDAPPRSHSSGSESEPVGHGDPPPTVRTEPAKRRGKAPPVDMFTGEDAEVRFEDWLPSLKRAADWNCWSADEQLIQLAGHLRGRAWQEWLLLEEEEKATFTRAIQVLKEALGPGSKILAAQDFRHTTQEETESVSSFVRRLERTFRVAYGADKLSAETRAAFLYGQLQEGLKHNLMNSPNVSGALTYKELVMAAKNEERRQSELKKRRQYQNPPKATTSSAATTKTNPASAGTNQSKPPNSGRSSKFCDFCRKPGHWKRDCRQRIKSESTGGGSHASKSTNPTIKASTKTVQTSSPPNTETESEIQDPMSLLYSSSDESDSIRAVRVQDEGSRPHYAEVLVQGVLSQGIIDSGADITIMGASLFQKFAAANRIKKRDFHKPDKVPHTYDQRTFILHGYLNLDVAFGDKTIGTRVYVKMDAHDELLLSEGVCRQLGIISYHPDVKVRSGPQHKVNDEEQPATVPTIRVHLLQSVRVPAGRSAVVPVQLKGGNLNRQPMLMERDPAIEESIGLRLEDALLQPSEDGIAHLRLSNCSGFTSVLSEGTLVGEAVEAAVIPPSQKGENSEPMYPVSDVKKISTMSESERKREVLKLLEEPDLPEPEKKLLCDFLVENHLAFSLEKGERGETDLIHMEIDTGDATPKKQPVRRMPYAARSEIARQLKEMQENGVIQASKSPWSSPVVLVQKKDGSLRFCIDYRELNSVTKADTFPLPRIDDLLDQLGKAKYFSKFDLASGFWQIRMHPQSQEKTAFSTPQGLYEFRVMPFGLTNAPSVFQRLIQQVLMGLNPDSGPSFVAAYIDDILVFSDTLKDHLNHLRLVLERLREVNLKLKPTKCRFARKEVEYLGHVLTPDGLKPNPALVSAVREFPVPTCLKELRRFLGLASYY